MPASHAMDHVFSPLLQRRQSQGTLRRLSNNPPSSSNNTLVDFSSNDYLSISRNAALQKEYLADLQHQFDTHRFALGSGGSRLLDGNSRQADALERTLARFYGADAGLLFNSGLDANSGLFACAPQPADVLVYDELVHASVHAGAKLSRVAAAIPFRHNCVHDDDDTNTNSLGSTRLRGLAGVLEALLQGTGAAAEALREGRRHVFVAVEAIYSMDGDIAPLRDVVACVERFFPLGNGHVVVDEAHSTGIVGQHGRGLVAHLGLEERVWARVHTFGKAMGCSGAIILCSEIARTYLINYARTLIYTTAMGPPQLASIAATHRFITSDQAEALRHKVADLVHHTHAQLKAITSSRHNNNNNKNHQLLLLRINDVDVVGSPILPVFTPHARDLAAHCQRRGYMVRAIVAPTVPAGTDRIRICLHAGNTVGECEGLCRAIEEWMLLRGAKPSVL